MSIKCVKCDKPEWGYDSNIKGFKIIRPLINVGGLRICEECFCKYLCAKKAARFLFVTMGKLGNIESELCEMGAELRYVLEGNEKHNDD